MLKSPLAGLITSLAVMFIVVFSFGALSVLQSVPNPSQVAASEAAPAAGAPAFAADVEARVHGADPSKGTALFQQYGCVACHGIKDGVAPYVVGIGQRAATRRPGYSAAAYLYESITAPNAFIAPNYPANVMPQNFKATIPDDQLYALVAWLLTQ